MTPASTQVVHPWRATARTLVAALIAFASVWGVVVETLQLDPNLGWVAAASALAALVTRLMASRAVDDFVRSHARWLSPDGGEQ